MSQKVNKPGIRVVVYGTLKADQPNEIVMQEAKGQFMGFDSITGPFRMVDLGGIPAVIDAPDETNTIFGQLYSVDGEGLATLDMLEGHPNFYCREKMWTDKMEKRAWIYLMKNERWTADVKTRPTIPDNLWKPTPVELEYWKEELNAA